MKLNKLLALAGTVALVGTAWATVSIPSSATAQDGSSDLSGTETHAAMYAACVSGDADTMHETNGPMSHEDWDTTESHPDLGMMNTGMMGSSMGGIRW